jgi:hypothetical protein
MWRVVFLFLVELQFVIFSPCNVILVYEILTIAPRDSRRVHLCSSGSAAFLFLARGTVDPAEQADFCIEVTNDLGALASETTDGRVYQCGARAPCHD